MHPLPRQAHRLADRTISGARLARLGDGDVAKHALRQRPPQRRDGAIAAALALLASRRGLGAQLFFPLDLAAKHQAAQARPASDHRVAADV